MTDKQIIIDGCDVSRCVYHEDGYCTISKQAYCYCCDKPNCHYKNWQRKEQECERLINKGRMECLNCEYKNAKFELNQLKGKVKLYEEILQRNTQGFETGATASMFAEMVNSVGNSIRDEKLFKLKATLAEITTFVQKEIEYFEHDVEYQYDWKVLMKLIKISECEVE